MTRIAVVDDSGLRRCWQVTRLESRVLRWLSAVLYCGALLQMELYSSGTSPPDTWALSSSKSLSLICAIYTIAIIITITLFGPLKPSDGQKFGGRPMPGHVRGRYTQSDAAADMHLIWL